MQHSIKNLPAFFFAALLCCVATIAWSQPPTVLRDINVATVGGNPRNMLSIGTTVFFSATQGFDGNELWKSQGGGSSTLLVQDINPIGDANPANFCNVNGKLFFTANNGSQGIELWQSNGTSSGTKIVADIVPNSDGSNPSQLTACNGRLFFTAIKRTVAANGAITNVVRIFVSNGTTAGTKVLNEVLIDPRSLTAVNNTLFFVATSTAGTELWKTDGVLVTPVKDINAGAGASSLPQNLVNVNGTLFFSATDGAHGRQLWKSNGTPAGTVPMSNQAGGLNIKEIAHANGKVFFAAANALPQLGNQVFRLKDNAVSGANDITPVTNATNASNLKSLGAAIVFVRTPQLGGTSLYRVAENSVIATSLHRFTENILGVPAAPQHLTVAGTLLYFTADSLATGRELWKSNGTVAGTVLVQDYTPGNTGSSISDLCPRGSEVFFAAFAAGQGNELHRSDGTPNAIDLVRNIGRAGSFPQQFTFMVTAQGNRTFFTADDGNNGRELWITDGTEAGTKMVKDLVPGPGGSNPRELTVVTQNNVSTLFFAAGDITGMLYKSDGTAAGTKVVQEVMVGLTGVNPNNLVAFKGELFYNATNIMVTSIGSIETKLLFRSNGTTAGTKAVTGFIGNPTNPKFMTVVGDNLFFSATDFENGRELWKHNGLTGSVVKNMRAGVFDSNPTDLINVGGALFFVADDGTGRQLCKSGGTAATTLRISNWHPANSGSAGIGNMTNFSGVLHFTAFSGTGNGDLMFKTNAGSTDIIPAAATGMGISNLKVSGSALFFVQSTEGGLVPSQLKKIQGNVVTPLIDFADVPYSLSTTPLQMTAVGGQMYFVNADTINGYELWRSDGTPAGTKIVSEVRAGIANAGIRELKLVGSNLMFSADNLTSGQEPFVLANVILLNEGAEDRANETAEAELEADQIPVTITVYPNPAVEFVSIDLSNAAADSEISLLTSSGQVVRHAMLSAGTESVRFDLEEVPGGIYFLYWKATDGQILTKKLIVQ